MKQERERDDERYKTVLHRIHLNSLAFLNLENRQLGQEEGEWDTFPFPLKQPLNNWKAVHWEVQ